MPDQPGFSPPTAREIKRDMAFQLKLAGLQVLTVAVVGVLGYLAGNLVGLLVGLVAGVGVAWVVTAVYLVRLYRRERAPGGPLAPPQL